MRNIFLSISDLFFARTCLNCGAVIRSPQYRLICEKCAESVIPIPAQENANTCEICSGRCYAVGKTVCFSCYESGYRFEKNTSVFYYHDSLIQELVHRFKFESNLQAGRDLAQMLAQPVRDFIQTRTHRLAFVIPLSKKSRRERGFNQVEYILDRIGISYSDILIRREHTVHQSQLNRKDRENLIKGQFRIKNEELPFIRNRDLLLIDDVFTTGSTAQECSSILLQAGAKSVEVFTFFRT